MRKTPGLPVFVLNHSLHTPGGRRIGIPDAYLPSVGIAIQVHSKAHHSGQDDAGQDLWSRTVEHDNAFAAHGILVLGVTPQTLARAPEGFIGQLLAALEARRHLPTPGVEVRCSQGCDAADALACPASRV